jgi:hypothetical protein
MTRPGTYEGRREDEHGEQKFHQFLRQHATAREMLAEVYAAITATVEMF